ncbi:MAG: peptidase [Deltaproteobacteria bacterium]|nr:peptidase [Deltaproteobacteria bacterium]
MKTPSHLATTALTLALLASACSSKTTHAPSFPSDALAGKCQSPRPGTGDRAGTAADEKAWLRAWTDDLYLWYREVAARTDLDPTGYATPQDYFEVLKTPALTASGRARDQFHFHMPTAEWEALASSGSELGYGMQVVLLSRSPPRRALVAYVEPGSPAARASIDRGAEILEVDGAVLLDGDPAVINGGLFPADTTPHTLVLADAGASLSRSVTMTPATVAMTPVPAPVVVQSPGGRKVGYVIMNDHLQAAEAGMTSAITQVRAAGVDDVVLDLRYNGGGYMLVASQTAYMLAGPARTSARIFERTIFNDKYPGIDPVAGGTVDMPFYPYRYFGSRGSALPTLSLPRLIVLTGGGTCSASESLMNGLAGVDLPVYQIGTTTCGKPYGFYPKDNCGTTWFSIQFQGVNAKGFGDYADGLVPGGTGGASFPGCAVADDFLHALGDPAEARLAAALAWADTGACPALPAAQAARVREALAQEREWVLPRSLAREMRLPLSR